MPFLQKRLKEAKNRSTSEERQGDSQRKKVGSATSRLPHPLFMVETIRAAGFFRKRSRQLWQGFVDAVEFGGDVAEGPCVGHGVVNTGEVREAGHAGPVGAVD